MNDKNIEKQERREARDEEHLSRHMETIMRHIGRNGLTKEQAKEKIKKIIDSI